MFTDLFRSCIALVVLNVEDPVRPDGGSHRAKR